MAVLIQTDVKTVPESAEGGSSEGERTRNLGTTEANQGLVERSSLNHCPVVAWASLLRL